MELNNETTQQSNLDATIKQRTTRINPLANRNFRLLWIGENISLLGDQFHYVALPWLTLQITGSVLALGTMMMVAGIPRAVFTLVGGVFSDRFSPRTMMLVSNLARLVITFLLFILMTIGIIQLWMLYAIALLFGLVDAFFYPAFMAMAPTLLDESELQSGNAVMQGGQQVVQSVGPGIAGVVVSVVGIAISFALDALTFLLSSVTLLLMNPPDHLLPANRERKGVFTEIKEMFAAVLGDSLLCTVIVVMMVINFLLTGPLSVGPAALAKDRFAEGPVALGVILSAFGIGSLLGMAVAGMLRPRRLGLVITPAVAIAGVGLAGVGFSWFLPLACLGCAVMGFIGGFTNILMVTWLQKRIAKEMMGRVMSLLMLASVGMAPISQAISGFLGEVDLLLMFAAPGVLMVLTAMVMIGRQDLRDMVA